MAHAPWWYGWWALPGLTQAHVITVEVFFLVLAYTALAFFALGTIDPGGKDPALSMLDPDDADVD